jgi:hypothetical protein
MWAPRDHSKDCQCIFRKTSFSCVPSSWVHVKGRPSGGDYSKKRFAEVHLVSGWAFWGVVQQKTICDTTFFGKQLGWWGEWVQHLIFQRMT